MASEDLDLVALICSRLCHDLAGSIGAVNNGVELLAEETDPKMREEAIGLVAQSANDAAKRLSFFRLALGASGGPTDPMGFGELARVAKEYFGGGKLSLLLPANIVSGDESLPKPLGKALLLGLSLAASALPRGGSLSLIKDGSAWSIRAEGTTIRWQDSVAAGFSDTAMLPSEPQAAVARYTRKLAESTGFRLKTDVSDSGVTLGFAK